MYTTDHIEDGIKELRIVVRMILDWNRERDELPEENINVTCGTIKLCSTLCMLSCGLLWKVLLGLSGFTQRGKRSSDLFFSAHV